MKPFFMMEKGLFKAPKSEELKLEEGDGVGTVQDVTYEYHKEREEGKASNDFRDFLIDNIESSYGWL